MAERGTRLTAVTVDDLILLAICLPAIFGALPSLAAAAADFSSGASLEPKTLILAMLTGPGGIVSLLAMLAWAVITTWMVRSTGQTIGKRMLGIKVVRRDGSRASLARIFWLRNVLNTIPGWLPYVGFGYQLVDPLLIFHESRRCLHDHIADTIVIKA